MSLIYDKVHNTLTRIAYGPFQLVGPEQAPWRFVEICNLFDLNQINRSLVVVFVQISYNIVLNPFHHVFHSLQALYGLYRLYTISVS